MISLIISTNKYIDPVVRLNWKFRVYSYIYKYVFECVWMYVFYIKIIYNLSKWVIASN